jgi:alpha-glucosidase
VAEEIASPDGRTVARVGFAEGGPTPGQLSYEVLYRGRPVVLPSRLGLRIAGGAMPERGWKLEKTERSDHDETWRPVCGEQSTIRDHYRQLVLDLEQGPPAARRLRLVLRAYDEGIAFCYTIPKQKSPDRFTIESELTEFRFAADHRCFATYTAQGVYEAVTLDQVKPNCERPLTLEIAGGPCAAIGEARLVDYARMRLQPAKGRPHTLIPLLGSTVEATAPYATPWRFVMVADTPAALLAHNSLVLNLNDPCALADTSWIQPGKVIREVTLTTTGGKACVDFAVRRGLQYVEFDAGWYGPENSDASDATGVHLDLARARGPLDLHEVIGYAGQRGIGIILYVNHKALERQADQIFPLYRKWGVKGVKFGFVNVGSQRWTAWLHAAVRKAAEERLMVDIHDEYRPTGYSRTYPNLMTMEGISGDETSPTNRQTLTVQFTRMLAGPADNTVCYYDARVDRNASHAYQLAKPVCLFSPWQFLYWYDRPAALPVKRGGAGNAQNAIHDEPELEFYDALPTVWDETRVLEGKIGEYSLIARRSGERWFLGCMNGGEARTFEVRLDFLDRGKSYVAHVYSDDPSVPTRTRVKIERRAVDAASVLRIAVSSQGGQAIRVTPQGK